MSINEVLQNAYELSLEERKKLVELLNENLNDPHLQSDPYFYERQKDLHKLREDIKSGKMEMSDFEESMDELINELES